jgi:hypothetical protein
MLSITDFLNAPQEAVESWTTGLPTLDQAVGGFRRGQLWVITGAPRTGKSLLAAQFVHRLGVEHDFAVSYGSARRVPAATTRARLVALSIGRSASEPPDHHLPENWPLTRDREALAWLCAAPIEVALGGGVGLPDESQPAFNTREAIVIDHEDPTGLSVETLAAFRRTADSGRIVVLTAPRSQCLQPSHDSGLGDRGERLHEEWASVSDVILEVIPNAATGYPEFVRVALNRIGATVWIFVRESRAWVRIQEGPGT